MIRRAGVPVVQADARPSGAVRHVAPAPSPVDAQPGVAGLQEKEKPRSSSGHYSPVSSGGVHTRRCVFSPSIAESKNGTVLRTFSRKAHNTAAKWPFRAATRRFRREKRRKKKGRRCPILRLVSVAPDLRPRRGFDRVRPQSPSISRNGRQQQRASRKDAKAQRTATDDDRGRSPDS